MMDFIYKNILKRILFAMPPELAHDLILLALGSTKGILPFMDKLFNFEEPKCQKELLGIKFKNPIGLAAGMDKDGILGDYWGHLGFGFVELGTITLRPQPGNKKPRLYRLLKENALLNRMGFNSIGVEKFEKNLMGNDLHLRSHKIPIGINIGKNKITNLEEAYKDYELLIPKLNKYADFFVVNVSSPNTPELRKLQGKAYLKPLLNGLTTITKTPILLKIAPDLTEKELDEIIDVSLETQISGMVATNTTIDHDLVEKHQFGEGGISGKPLFEKSTKILKYLRKNIKKGDFILIGVGGIFDSDTLKAKFDAGADLVELFSSYPYEGPNLIKKLVCSIEA